MEASFRVSCCAPLTRGQVSQGHCWRNGFLSQAPSSCLKWGPLAKTGWEGRRSEKVRGLRGGEGARDSEALAAWGSHRCWNQEETGLGTTQRGGDRRLRGAAAGGCGGTCQQGQARAGTWWARGEAWPPDPPTETGNSGGGTQQEAEAQRVGRESVDDSGREDEAEDVDQELRNS